ncbi:hypothetical protein LWI29_035388 [Acer saccharum]|uniref:Protein DETOXIFICATION n=1 Tax=Acer saccharum TaxID=4024 RepID=A0AA39VCT1_ACESA|nr:hypothetical protein LWI29_035388 [Acer saccharum]
MEEGLLVKKEELEEKSVNFGLHVEEVKRVSCIAAPMVAVNLSHYFLQVISTMMVGHLGELFLSSTAIATSFSAVTGFSLLFGMSTAMETLCGQGFGAKQYQKLGIQFQTALFSLLLVCLPVTLLWVNMGKLLLLLGQDPSIASEAGKYTLWLIPALFGYATLQPLELESFFRLAIPSAFMICLEWWSFEFLTLLSGLLPNPKLETSVLSVCLSTLTTLYTIPEGLGAAASTRVSNELGARNHRAAQTAVRSVMLITVLETILVSSVLFASRHVFGYVFSNEKEVVDYVTAMAPFLCLCIVLNGLQAVLSGIARGCGWQDMGAYVNLLAYYVFGIPVAAILGFWLHMRGQGLWIGILVGAFVQTVLLSIITSCLNWKKQADKARHRIFEDDGQT